MSDRVSNQTIAALGVVIATVVFVYFHNYFLIPAVRWTAQDVELWMDMSIALQDTPMYETAATRDNKPPGMLVILYILGLFGGSKLAFVSSAALSIGIATGLVYLVATRLTTPLGGLSASLIWLSAMGSVHLLENGPRPWSAVFMLAAAWYALDDRPIEAGLSIAVAGLIWQYAGLLFFALLLPLWAEKQRFTITTTVVGVVILLLPDLFIQTQYDSFFSSVLIALEHATPMDLGIGHGLRIRKPQTAHRAFFQSQTKWGWHMWRAAWQLTPIVILGLLGGLYNRFIAVAMVIMIVPFFAKSHTTYWMLLIPFLAIGMVIYLHWVVTNDTLLHNLYESTKRGVLHGRQTENRRSD